MKPNGEFEITAWASTNRTCTIEYSGDLSIWTTLTNFAATGQTPVTVIDTEAPGQAQRFYRMK